MHRRDFRKTATAGSLAAVEKPNRAAVDEVVYIPTGFFKGYQAWRNNVTGVVNAPFPVFWDVKKA
jgi:peptide/nickel transport system substrate-binding protein